MYCKEEILSAYRNTGWELDFLVLEELLHPEHDGVAELQGLLGIAGGEVGEAEGGAQTATGPPLVVIGDYATVDNERK